MLSYRVFISDATTLEANNYFIFTFMHSKRFLSIWGHFETF